MTIATVEKKLDGLIALIKERLPAIPAPVVPTAFDFIAMFPKLGPVRSLPGDGVSEDGVWWVEQKVAGRALIVPGGKDGTALRLHTEPGDTNVSGSGTHERCDLALRGVNERKQGDEDWWSHSILFPGEFAIPPAGHWCLVWNFHDLRNQGGQACYQMFVGAGGQMTLRGYGGPTFIYDASKHVYGADLGPLVRNTWYDFTINVRWSDTAGFMHVWMNGKKVLTHVGPTLYSGYGVFAKCSLYHSAWGEPSSVLHDRIIRGKSASVAVQLLE